MSTDQRIVSVIRETYRVIDDGHGGSVAETIDTDITDHECAGYTFADGCRESAAREAAGIIRREYLSYGADGGDWFGTPEPYSHPYRDEETRTTAHLNGPWSDTERRAIIRMVEWLDAADDRRARGYAARFTY